MWEGPVLGCPSFGTLQVNCLLYLSLLTAVPSNIILLFVIPCSQNRLPASLSLSERHNSATVDDFYMEDYICFWWSYKKCQVLSCTSMMIFQRKSVFDVAMNSPLSLIQSSHCFCIIIFCKMCWQMQYIFKFLSRTVWQIPTKIPFLCTHLYFQVVIRAHSILCLSHIAVVPHFCLLSTMQVKLPTIRNCSWMCGAPQSPWTRKLFTVHHLKHLQCVSIISFLSSWKNLMLSHGLIHSVSFHKLHSSWGHITPESVTATKQFALYSSVHKQVPDYLVQCC
jgi:hypothetical protein